MSGPDRVGGLDRVLDEARAWLAQDPDPATSAELAALIASASNGEPGARAELESRFAGRLQFGTAGLRAELGAGPMRMNRVVVAQAAAGLAAYLREKITDRAPLVVIGYDGRRNSSVFAHDSAELFAGAGMRTVLLPRLLPTPVLAFAVRRLSSDAGVMVTASHNPPNDNGYKVYLGGADAGSQIVPPADGEIAAHIARVAAAPITQLPRSGDIEIAPESLIDDYVAATAAVAPAPNSAAGMRWAYTAMHGVGWETFARVLDATGYPRPALTAAQLEPDGTFPTLAFPNPEEPGALDLAFRTATESGAEFVIAHDPDADRLGVAIPDGDGWRRLTGNEIGLLLGRRAARTAAGTAGASLACSLVSSPGLGAIAERYGLDFHETLTGFKWISRVPGLVFGFEEALGYLVNPQTVRDKDGISASIALLELAAQARGEGRTIADLLDDLWAEIGVYRDGQVSLRVEDVSLIGRITGALRTNPPAAFGDVAVVRADDLAAGGAGLPAADVLRYTLADGARVIVRPSGTEPKLKVYLDVRGADAAEAEARLAALDTAVRELLARLS